MEDNEVIIPGHFIHEIKTKGNDVIGVNALPLKLMRFSLKKWFNSVPIQLLRSIRVKRQLKNR